MLSFQYNIRKGLIKMKKILSLILVLAVVISSCAVFVSAYEKLDADEISEYPLIIVPGYSSSSLCLETGEVIWGLNMDEVLDRVLNRIIDLGMGLGALTVGNAEILAATLGEEINGLFEKMRCNPDGTSVYNVRRVVSGADETNNANLMVRYPNGDHRQEQEMAEEFAEYIGHENIFNFTCDFRMGSEACATLLDELVQDVKKYTGKDKVNILAVSHGGQVTATYLTLFGWKNDVDNVVMTVPAIGGAGIAYDLMSQTVEFDEECLLRFIEHGMRWEEDYNWLLKAQQLGFLDAVLNSLVPHIMPTLGYWGSLWDFIPLEKYEATKAKLLDSTESAALIAKSDRFHYEIYPKMGEKMAECIANGANISIISGTGNRIVTGLKESSDGIITTSASTGAKTAPYGQRFADGYVQVNPCGGKNKISPDMTIDASTAYMPDNTWFVNGLFHGMTYWDYYSRELMMTLLFTDKLTDVYSDPDFPQFKDTTNPSSAVYASFEGCEAGEINGETKKLVITNCCWENDISLSAIYCDGIDLSVKINPFEKLAPGESVALEFKGEIPEVSGAAASITVYYTMATITPIGYRTQYFTINNGEPVSSSDGFVDLIPSSPIEKLPGGEGIVNILGTLGLSELVTMFINIIFYWINTIFAI